MTKVAALGVVTGHNDLGAAACRPYDRDRDGYVLGEGGAFVVLEDEDTARKRGAEIYAEVVGVGSGFDLNGLVNPSPDGRALANAIGGALDEAGVNASAVDYIATDGCATAPGDASEAAALRSALGSAASRVAASSVKAATGHLVAGAGALNVAVAALAIRHATIPPTLNLTNVDPACQRIAWVPGEAHCLRVGHAPALAHRDRAVGAAVVAAEAAMDTCGRAAEQIPAERWDVVIGTCNAGLLSARQWYQARMRGEHADAGLLLFGPPQAVAEAIAGAFGLRGPALSVNTACAAGANAVGYAAELIRSGQADAVISGGTDALSDVLVAGFHPPAGPSPAPAPPHPQHRPGPPPGRGGGQPRPPPRQPAGPPGR